MKKIFVLMLVILTVTGCKMDETKEKKNLNYNSLVKDLKVNLPRSFRPENPYTYYTMANVTHKTLPKVSPKKKDAIIESVISNYKKTIKLDPSFAPAYYGLGLVLLEKKDNKEANINFEKAVQLNPDIESYHLAYALTCDRLDNEECAAKQYADVIDLNPENVEATVLLANIYYKNKQYENARELFDMVLKVDPENDIAKLALKDIEKNHPDALLNKKAEEQINDNPETSPEVDKKVSEKIDNEVKEELIKAKDELNAH
ncbi:MAG: tetratricopeptide repeat protein [Vampirovibrionia bacterium]